MRTPPLHRILAAAIALILAGSMASTAQARVATQFPTLAAPTISYALHAKGVVVRSEDGLIVTQISLDGAQQARPAPPACIAFGCKGPTVPGPSGTSCDPTVRRSPTGSRRLPATRCSP